MAKISRTVFMEATLTADEIRSILVAFFGTQRAGGVIIPEKARFELDDKGAIFNWNEGGNG